MYLCILSKHMFYNILSCNQALSNQHEYRIKPNKAEELLEVTVYYSAPACLVGGLMSQYERSLFFLLSSL